MGPLTLSLVFLVSLLIVVGILYWQGRRIRRGEIILKGGRNFDTEAPFRLRDVLILLLYLIKHAVQFIIVQLSRLYFFLERRIRNISIHKHPRVARITGRLKVPPIPPQARAFLKKTVEETKQKIMRVKKDLAELEETMDKRVD